LRDVTSLDIARILMIDSNALHTWDIREVGSWQSYGFHSSPKQTGAVYFLHRDLYDKLIHQSTERTKS